MRVMMSLSRALSRAKASHDVVRPTQAHLACSPSFNQIQAQLRIKANKGMPSNLPPRKIRSRPARKIPNGCLLTGKTMIDRHEVRCMIAIA